MAADTIAKGKQMTAGFIILFPILFLGAAAAAYYYIPYPEFQLTPGFQDYFLYQKIASSILISILFFYFFLYGAANLVKTENNHRASFKVSIYSFSIIVSCWISWALISFGCQTFPAAYAYSYTKRYGTLVTRDCAVSKKKTFHTRAGYSYNLIFEDGCFGRVIGHDVDRNEYEEIQVGEVFELSAAVSQYGVLLNKVSRIDHLKYGGT